MKRIILCLCLASCAVTPETVTPDQAATLEQLQSEQAAATASGDQVAIADAAAKLDAFEDQVMRERAGPVVAGLAAVNPWLAAFSPLLLGFAPLLGKRGRQHAKNGLKALNPFDKDTPGKIKVGQALVDLGKYAGILHSSPASEAAANAG